MRAKEFITEHTAWMAKVANTGKIVRIIRKQHTVKFSNETGWLLIDTDPEKGNKGQGLKWVPASTRFEWVKPYRETIDEAIDFTNAVNSIEQLIRQQNIQISSYEQLVQFVSSRKFLQPQRNDTQFITDVAQAVLRRLHKK